MKKNIMLLLVAVILLLPIGVNAKGNLEISCDKNEFKSNDKITCDLKVNSDKEIYGIDANITSDNSNVKLEFIGSKGSTSSYNNTDGILAWADPSVPKSATIGQLVINVGEVSEDSFNINFNKFVIFTNTADEVKLEKITKTFTRLSESSEEVVETTTNSSNENNPSTSDLKITAILASILALVSVIVIASKKIKNN